MMGKPKKKRVLIETVNTGGTKNFVYNGEDAERIRLEDTESTRAFKKALRKYYKGVT